MSIPQLLLVKATFHRGQEALSEKAPYSAGFAVSLFQDAVELMAWTIAKEVDGKVSDKGAFEAIWDAIKAGQKNTQGKDLPLKAKMIELNKARVGFKHYGNLPALSEAFKFETYTEQFLEQSCRLFFESEFKDVSLIDLIQHKDAATHLKAAEVAISTENAESALSECALAFYYLNSPLNALVPRLGKTRSGMYGADVSRSDQLLDVRITNAENNFNSLRNFTVASTLGFSLFDYSRFFLITPGVSVSLTGKYQLQWLNGRRPDLENARFALKFVTDFGIAVEGALAELTDADRELLFGKRKLVPQTD